MKNSQIEWTDHTYSAWLGCTKVSPGCDHCYAEAMWDHRYHRVEWGPHGERNRTKTAGEIVRLNRSAAKSGVREQVFTASSSDVFDNQVPAEWRSDLFDLIRRCTALDWLVLTKRPQNMREMLPADWGAGWPHVWLGTSTETGGFRSCKPFPPGYAFYPANRYLRRSSRTLPVFRG